jgi:hypothetical protein
MKLYCDFFVKRACIEIKFSKFWQKIPISTILTIQNNFAHLAARIVLVFLSKK